MSTRRGCFRELASYALRSVLGLTLGLAFLGFLPGTAQAANPVDLVLGGEGASSWSITNIKPGDNGLKTVTLHNAGYQRGLVTIWVSNIVNSEGNNPESETGNTSEPGEVGNYLLFRLSGPGLSTNLSFPVKIGELPQSASAPNYIKINPLNPGDTISLDWRWELPAATGNDVQGDSLSFTINYVLEAEVITGGGDDGAEGDGEEAVNSPVSSPLVDGSGNVTDLAVKPSGKVNQSYVIGSDLTVSPHEPRLGEVVTVSLILSNRSDTAVTYDLPLMVDGTVMAVKKVTLGPGSTGLVTFELSGLAEGTHRVEVAGLSAGFSITRPQLLPVPLAVTFTSLALNLPTFGLIIATFLVVNSLVLSLVKPDVLLGLARRFHI